MPLASYATGLLDYLEEEFRRANTNVVIDLLPVSSWQALRIDAQGIYA